MAVPAEPTRSLSSDRPGEPRPGCDERTSEAPGSHNSSMSFRGLGSVLWRRRRLVASMEGGLLLACLLYCLVAPEQYEAHARVALRTTPESPLSLDAPGQAAPSSAAILSGPLQQETVANYLRSDRLAWRVICDLKLYQAPGFNGRFAKLFPGFQPGAQCGDGAAPDAQAYLLDRFQRRLMVETLPRSLVIQIRFRSRDAALSAAVVNDLIREYGIQDGESRLQATARQTGWLQMQLMDLKARVDQNQQRLIDFQQKNGLLDVPVTQANGQSGESEHNSTLLAIDELGRDLVVATTDRILREAEYRAAAQGDPEVVIASDPRLQAEYGNFATALLEQIRTRRSELELEQTRLSIEHGQNFPRVVEIRLQTQDLDAQKKAEDAKLVDRFHSALQTAIDREQMVKQSLEGQTAAGMKLNQAATTFAVMRQEADFSSELYLRVQAKVEEAGLAAGIQESTISVVDQARQPVKPVSPDLLLYMAITFVVGLWLVLGVVLLLESLGSSAGCIAVIAGLALLLGVQGRAQAPTPALDGLPTGVARLPFSPDTKTLPNPKDAPGVWNGTPAPGQAGVAGQGGLAAPMPAPIGPGDVLDVNEYSTPEFHAVVRVSEAGTVMLPMVHEVQIGGLDELGAAQAIEAALVAKGMLLHPQVAVLVTMYAGQDVSVLGEVARPGVYPYAVHHRLLDLISAAQGLSQNAGRLVNVYHRLDPDKAHPVALDPEGADSGGTDAGAGHNPELLPGDVVQVSRAGLVYVIGDVIRPGGFPVDPVQGLTVVQALSLAWGTSQNAASGKALLIHEEKGGRTLTTLNLRRMIHGQDPDLPIRDRDILFVPDSMAKSLLNRTVEAAIQSAVGVSIYAGLVYSQRF